MSNKSNNGYFEHNRRQQRSSAHESDTLDNLKRDRWELLNAYLDNEVSPSERRMVERWLQTSNRAQCLYARLLQLRSHVQTIPVPSPEKSVEEVVQSVCRKIDRQRIRRSVMWGGAAVAAVLGALFSSNVTLHESFANVFGDRDGAELTIDGLSVPMDKPLIPDLNKTNNSVDIPLDSLILSVPLDRPILDIPKPTTVQAESLIDEITPSSENGSTVAEETL